MTSSPHVELLAGDLGPSALQRVDGKRLGTIEETISSGIMSYRLLVVNHVKQQMAKEAVTTGEGLLRLVDQAVLLYLRRFTTIIGPSAADAYLKAFGEAGAPDVPVTTIVALADQHAERIGRYYGETSKDALIQAFNTFTNRQLPPRVAAERAVDAFGLTPRQMSGYTSLDTKTKVESARPSNLLARAREYLSRAVRTRAKTFGDQEAHNLDYQAKQTAWTWMQDQGILTERAQKMWLTAKDEKTCKICGPMHGKKVAVTERFVLPNNIEVWVPGPHPNCRCEVRVLDVRLTEVEKADFSDPARAIDRDKDNIIFEGTKHEQAVRKPGVSPAQAQALRAQRYADSHAARQAGVSRADPEQIRALQGTLRQLEALEQEILRRRAQARPSQLKPVEATEKPAAVALDDLVPLGSSAASLADLKPIQIAEEAEREPIVVEEVHNPPAFHLAGRPTEIAKPAFELAGKPEVAFELAGLPKTEQARQEIEETLVRPLAQPVYRIVTHVDEAGQYHFVPTGKDEDKFVYRNRQEAVESAAAMREMLIEQHRETIESEYGPMDDKGEWVAAFKANHPALGNTEQKLEVRLTGEDLDTVLYRLAQMSNPSAATSAGTSTLNEPIELHAFDIGHGKRDFDRLTMPYGTPVHDGEDVEGIPFEVTPTQIGMKFGVVPEDFLVAVQELREVHDERGMRGRSETGVDSITDQPFEVPEGKYEMYDMETDTPFDEHAPIDVIKIRPQDPAPGVRFLDD